MEGEEFTTVLCTTSSSTTLRPRSTTRSPATISTSTPNLHLMSAIPLPHSFVRMSSRPPGHLSPKTQHSQLPIPSVQRSVSSALFHSLPTTQKRSLKTQTQHSTPFHDDSPSTHPLQGRSLNFYSTYPPLDILQSCQDDQWSSEGSPSPVMVDNSRDTSLSIHDVPSVPLIPFHPPSNSQKRHSKTQPRHLRLSPTTYPFQQRSPNSQSTYQCPVSHYPYPFTPFSSMYSSLLPLFRRQENFHGRRSQLTPSLSTTFSIPASMGSQRSSTALWPSPTAPTTEHRGSMPSSMPHTLYSLPKTGQLSPSSENEQIQPPLPDIPMVKDERLPTTMIRASAAHCLCSSTSNYSNNTRKQENLKYKVKVEGIDEQATGEMEVAVEGEEVAEALSSWSDSVQLTPAPVKTTDDHIAIPVRTLYRSTASQSMSMAPYISNSAHNLHQGPTTPLPPSIPLSHSLANAVSQHSTCFSPKRRSSSLPPPFHRLNGFNGQCNMQSEWSRSPPS